VSDTERFEHRLLLLRTMCQPTALTMAAEILLNWPRRVLVDAERMQAPGSEKRPERES